MNREGTCMAFLKRGNGRDQAESDLSMMVECQVDRIDCPMKGDGNRGYHQLEVTKKRLIYRIID